MVIIANEVIGPLTKYEIRVHVRVSLYRKGNKQFPVLTEDLLEVLLTFNSSKQNMVFGVSFEYYLTYSNIKWKVLNC